MLVNSAEAAKNRSILETDLRVPMIIPPIFFKTPFEPSSINVIGVCLSQYLFVKLLIQVYPMVFYRGRPDRTTSERRPGVAERDRVNFLTDSWNRTRPDIN